MACTCISIEALMKNWLLMGIMLAAGCASAGGEADDPVGRVRFVDVQGQPAGEAWLFAENGGIRVTVELPGLPAGDHGLHFHAVGVCTPPNFESAGGHFNPTSRQHGRLNPNGPHLGDLPNVEGGRTHVSVTTAGLQINGPNGLLDDDGAALVVHQSSDDLRTDPSGNSGARIRCGVVERP
jgi:Cu-Zn family superoxide dismutase